MEGLESEIIRRFKRGEKSAFCDLVEIHKERVYALAYSWLCNRADSLDATQLVFLRLYYFLPRWQKRAQLSTWLYRTTVNLCIDIARKKKRERDGLERFARESERAAGTRSAPERDEMAETLRQEIYKLPPRQKAVIVLRHYRALSLKEIAGILKCPLGTVKANLYFALGSLRKRLKKKGAGEWVDKGKPKAG